MGRTSARYLFPVEQHSLPLLELAIAAVPTVKAHVDGSTRSARIGAAARPMSAAGLRLPVPSEPRPRSSPALGNRVAAAAAATAASSSLSASACELLEAQE